MGKDSINEVRWHNGKRKLNIRKRSHVFSEENGKGNRVKYRLYKTADGRVDYKFGAMQVRGRRR